MSQSTNPSCLPLKDSLLEILFEHNPTSIVVVDRALRILSFNPAWAALPHRHRGLFASEPRVESGLFEILPCAESVVRPLVDSVLRGETVQRQSVLLEAAGIESYWQILLNPLVEDGSTVGFVHMMTDITDQVVALQQQSESIAELEASEEALRSLVESAGNFAIFRMALDPANPLGARIIFVSPFIRDLIGMEDPLRFDSWFDNVHPDDIPKLREANQRAFENGEPFEVELRLHHPARQTWAWIQARSNPIFDETGTLTHFNGLIIDITAQKEAEIALRHRVVFEEIITTISASFVNLSPDEIDCGIQRALEAIANYNNADRSYLFLYSSDRLTMDNTHEWCAPGIKPQREQLQGIEVGSLPWSNGILMRGDVLYIPNIESLPPEAHAERQELFAQGTRSVIAVPMLYRGSTLGFLGFDSVLAEKTWTSEGITLLKTVGELFVNALEHKRDQEALNAARQTLEQRVRERTQELTTLLEVSHNVNSTLDLEPLLGLILDQVRTVVDYNGTSIITLEGEQLAVRAYRGPIPQEVALKIRFTMNPDTVNRQVLLKRTPIIIPDTLANTKLAEMFREGAGGDLRTTYGYIRSWIGVPLLVRDQVIGMLTLDHQEPDFFTPQHAELVMTFANQVAVAIENANLYLAEQERFEESERRRRVAEGLRDILKVLNSDRSAQETLDYIAAQSCELMGAKASIIHHLHRDQSEDIIEASCGIPDLSPQTRQATRLSDGYADRAIFDKQPYTIPDLRAYLAVLDTPQAANLDPGEREWRQSLRIAHSPANPGAFLAIPLVVRDRVDGSIDFYYDKPRKFTEEDIQLAVALGDQVSLAIENARLRTKVAESAVVGERSRLARELHDAVTQTLFSASLIAEVLPILWERNPEEGRRRLAELRELSRGALAEMRTLLLELRPSALVEANLADLMRQLAESITGRARVPVVLNVEGDCELSAEVKIALYRIAQEALNNVAKHSAATHASVDMVCQPDCVEMLVCDDGLGFDINSIAPNSLGLGIMRERAETIGAQLQLESLPGEGTKVAVRWQQCHTPQTTQTGSGHMLQTGHADGSHKHDEHWRIHD